MPWFLCVLWSVMAAAETEPFVFHHENVLGTRLELQVWADSFQVAQQAEAAALAEIDRLAAVLSTYDPHSELSRWQQSGQPQRLSADLLAVLKVSDHWHAITPGAFHPGAEVFTQLWLQAERDQRLPSSDDRQRLVLRLHQPPWSWLDETTAAPNGSYPISLNAIAKGAIIEQACRRMLAVPGVHGSAVKIGGDLRVMGAATLTVDIAAPHSSVEPRTILDTVTVTDAALATSSGAFRGVTIAGQRYSHVIDPRTGWPADHVLSASVIAPHAADADALATACSVLSVDDSLQRLDATPGAAGLLLDRAGHVHRSARWPTHESIAQSSEPKLPPWNGGMELDVTFEINQAVGGGRYRRPYVAVWIEDGDGFPVRTLVLWVQTSGPGPRWIPDLKRWYRSERVRKLADGTDLIPTVSEATRKPGQYHVVWSGADDAGKLVNPGDYTLYIEAAREHGTYQLIRKPIVLREQAFKTDLEGNTEIKAAAVEYRKAKAAPAATGT